MGNNDYLISGAKLAGYDLQLDLLNGLTFQDAYYQGVGDLEAQKAHALSPDFKSPLKEERDRVLRERNAVAQMLGFQTRQPHDYGTPRDYYIRSAHLRHLK